MRDVAVCADSIACERRFWAGLPAYFHANTPAKPASSVRGGTPAAFVIELAAAQLTLLRRVGSLAQLSQHWRHRSSRKHLFQTAIQTGVGSTLRLN
jgi:hypothetical protein